jgi:hypothetical protein
MKDSDNLKPDDFPVHPLKKEIIKTDGSKIAEAVTSEVAQEIADRLNSEEHRREEDRWA